MRKDTFIHFDMENSEAEQQSASAPECMNLVGAITSGASDGEADTVASEGVEGKIGNIGTYLFNLFEHDYAHAEVQTDKAGINVCVQTEAKNRVPRRGRVNGRATETDDVNAVVPNVGADVGSITESHYSIEPDVVREYAKENYQHEASTGHLSESQSAECILSRSMQHGVIEHSSFDAMLGPAPCYSFSKSLLGEEGKGDNLGECFVTVAAGNQRSESSLGPSVSEANIAIDKALLDYPQIATQAAELQKILGQLQQYSGQ